MSGKMNSETMRKERRGKREINYGRQKWKEKKRSTDIETRNVMISFILFQ